MLKSMVSISKMMKMPTTGNVSVHITVASNMAGGTDKSAGIRSAILEGDIDKALKFTHAFYPNVLPNNQQVHFRLKCRKFVEMVRRAAQLHMALDSSYKNGHGAEASPQRMEVDQGISDNSTWDVNMDADASTTTPELEELEANLIQYGQSLQAEYSSDPRKEVTKALSDIWVLIAYKNPLKEPKVSHLLDRKGRLAVAEELNSAILREYKHSIPSNV